MTPREKKDFGKKPARGSKTEEQGPERVYRPRTARPAARADKAEQANPPHAGAEANDDYSTSRSFDKDSPETHKKRSTSARRDEGMGLKRSGQRPTPGQSSREDAPMYRSRTHGGARREIDSKPKDLWRDNDTSGSSSGHADESYTVKRNESKPIRSMERGDARSSARSRREAPAGAFGQQERTEQSKGRGAKVSRPDRVGKPDRPTKALARTKRPEGLDGTGFQRVRGKSKQPPRIAAELTTDGDGNIRINKYIANSGLCSRREADEYIKNGFITVNGEVVTQLGTKVKLTDEVRFKGKGLDPENKVYILLNKPKDYITTVDDPNAKRTVMELIEGACSQRVYPVGRLDRNSTGLLLLTNDGELTKRLTHPSHNKKKVYEVGLDKPLSPSDRDTMVSGVQLDDGTVRADQVDYIDPRDPSIVGVELHSGQNRVVRRMLEALGYAVKTLDRVYFAGLTKKALPRGKWRFLSPKEVSMLKTGRFD